MCSRRTHVISGLSDSSARSPMPSALSPVRSVISRTFRSSPAGSRTGLSPSDLIRWSCQTGPGPFSKSSARVSVGPSAIERAGPIPVKISMTKTSPHNRIASAAHQAVIKLHTVSGIDETFPGGCLRQCR